MSNPKLPRTKKKPARRPRSSFEVSCPTQSRERRSARDWFVALGWSPLDFQTQSWEARLRGASGLIISPTGAGKTYAAVLGALEFSSARSANRGLRLLYVTPLKAVARDIRLAIESAVIEMGLPYRVEDRTGDTSAHRRSKQKQSMPEVLITTPESLSQLLCDVDHERHFRELDTVVLDEWHECLSSKRGSLLELSTARLRALRPELATWALTATIQNIEEAARAAIGESAKEPTLIRSDLKRGAVIRSLLPPQIDAFPWAGHLGLSMLKPLLAFLDPVRSTLIFTNTRSQAERWFQALSNAVEPEIREKLALHHGSLDGKERERVESGVKGGSIAWVVCTSTLDLGVDFGPVERVVQVGSPKSLARLVQRAGRAAHRPKETSSVLFVPTNALELLEIAAARRGVADGWIEPRHPIEAPLDVLVQHVTTRAIGGGFTREEILREIHSAYSFRHFSEPLLDWTLKFLESGGVTLTAYPDFHKLTREGDRFVLKDLRLIRLHKMNIGTIVSDATVALKFQRGKTIGMIEESFVSKLKKGDRFLFAGRVLEYLGLRDLDASVKLGRGSATVSPSWPGSRLPYSSLLGELLRRVLDDWKKGESKEPEALTLSPILEMQSERSRLPSRKEILVESVKTKQGQHLFVYPFEGRPLHEGLSAIFALRLSRLRHNGTGNGTTFSISCNDYGFELLGDEDLSQLVDAEWERLTDPENLLEDLRGALDLTQLARQKFREIARVAGLVHPGRPRERKTSRQLQASAGLLFDVFRRHEPGHPLVAQAETQVLNDQLMNGRLPEAFERLRGSRLALERPPHPTPFGFPLVAERISARLSTESLTERLEKLKREWTRA